MSDSDIYQQGMKQPFLHGLYHSYNPHVLKAMTPQMEHSFLFLKFYMKVSSPWKLACA